MNWRREADRMAAEARGRHGEALACNWLREQGFEILAQRVETLAERWTLLPASRALSYLSRSNGAPQGQSRFRHRSAPPDPPWRGRPKLLAPGCMKAGDDMRVEYSAFAPGAMVRHPNAWMPI
jgi:putative endonuclease